MASCRKNFTSEEIINLIIGEENKTKKVPRVEKETNRTSPKSKYQ